MSSSLHRSLLRALGALPLVALSLTAGAAAQEGPAAPEPAGERTTDAERVFELTLEDALHIALRNNITLRLEEQATERAHFDALGSWGAFDPNVRLTGSAESSEFQGTSSLAGGSVVENDSLGLDGTLSVPFTSGGTLDLTLSHSNEETTNQFAAFDVSTTDVFTVALTQPLLRGAWRRYATALQRQAELGYETQRESEREARQRLLRDVANAYWDLASAIEELRVREIAVELGEKQLEQDQKRLQVGVGTEVDVLQSETNVAQQEELRLQAESNLRAAEDNLRVLLAPPTPEGLQRILDEWDTPIRPLTPLPDVGAVRLPDWRAALQRAVAQRPELVQRRLEIDSAEIGVTTARSDRLPGLDLNLSASGVGFDADPSEAFETAVGFDFPSQTASLTFSVPLLNRSARYALRAARADLRVAHLNYEATELTVVSEVRAAVRDVRFSGESVQAAITSRNLAERQLAAEESRQRVGSSTTFQVLEFQEDLAAARSAEVAARASYAKALVSLRFAEGELDTELQDVIDGDDRDGGE